MSISLTKIKNNQYRYNRGSSVDYDKLCQIISSKYSNNHCLVTPSGLNAIDLAFHTIFCDNQWKDINLVHSWEMYCETPLLFYHYQDTYPNMDLKIYEQPICSGQSDNSTLIQLFSEEIKDKVNILFLESCSNMSGWFLDFDIISKLREFSKKLYVIVDNTWLTSVIFNPFSYNVDIVANSLSKHYSGGNCISGCIVIKDNRLYQIAKEWYTCRGYHVSDYNCRIILKNIRLIKSRLIRNSLITTKVIQYLLKNKNVLEISYPLLKKNNSYSFTKKYFLVYHEGEIIGPDIFAFQVDINKQKLMPKLQEMEHIQLKTSYGGPDTRIDSFPIEICDKTWCRLSIGYQDNYQDIVKELEIILSN